jgi:ligand-binding sensor domain-containing protein
MLLAATPITKEISGSARLAGGLFRARRQAVTPYGKAQGLNFSEIYPLLETRDGALWIGAYGEASSDSRTAPSPNMRLQKEQDWHSFSGLVSSLYEDHKGQLWVNGVWILADGQFVDGPWTKAFLQQVPGAIWSMCEDSEGSYWFGVEKGVMRYKEGAFTKYTTNDGLAGNDTKVIIQDGQGGLWFGSYGGLTHYKDGKFTGLDRKRRTTRRHCASSKAGQ